jgi:hypothetical protein
VKRADVFDARKCVLLAQTGVARAQMCVAAKRAETQTPRSRMSHRPLLGAEAVFGRPFRVPAVVIGERITSKIVSKLKRKCRILCVLEDEKKQKITFARNPG